MKFSDELAEELHKPLRHKFPKRRVMVQGIDDTWAADLVEMGTLSRHNKGSKYLLTIIDIFSKFGWIVPLKDKKGSSVVKAFRKVFRDSSRRPKKLWTDKGREFYNKDVRQFLSPGTELYSTDNEEKSSVVERWNRTMKERMFRYFTANSTRTYIDVLPDIVNRYNNSKHRSTGMTPNQASQKENEGKVYFHLYKDVPPRVKPKLSIGDRVRITKRKGIFEKGYTPRWTEETFVVTEVLPTQPPTYKISDQRGEVIQGSFYEQELQKTDQSTFRIEKVLRKRTRNGMKELFVKWQGYPTSFNSWIKESDLV